MGEMKASVYDSMDFALYFVYNVVIVAYSLCVYCT